MPGSRLTVAQACRRWQLDVVVCAKVSERLRCRYDRHLADIESV